MGHSINRYYNEIDREKMRININTCSVFIDTTESKETKYMLNR